jgi:hypothetical protein
MLQYYSWFNFEQGNKYSINDDMWTTTVTFHSSLSSKTENYRPLQCSQTPDEELYRSFLYVAFTDKTGQQRFCPMRKKSLFLVYFGR